MCSMSWRSFSKLIGRSFESYLHTSLAFSRIGTFIGNVSFCKQNDFRYFIGNSILKTLIDCTVWGNGWRSRKSNWMANQGFDHLNHMASLCAETVPNLCFPPITSKMWRIGYLMNIISHACMMAESNVKVDFITWDNVLIDWSSRKFLKFGETFGGW